MRASSCKKFEILNFVSNDMLHRKIKQPHENSFKLIHWLLNMTVLMAKRQHVKVLKCHSHNAGLVTFYITLIYSLIDQDYDYDVTKD